MCLNDAHQRCIRRRGRSMNASSVFASRNRQMLRSNIMPIIDISHRKIDSEHTSPSAGVQGTCCQVSINPIYSQQSSDLVQSPAKVRATVRYTQSD